MEHSIHAVGVKVNNLKNITVDIPHGKMVVITGLSGSGKSSLAFDTLYAEGQRRYVESLSAYARQFLGRMPKPDCDSITGLPPAACIRQHVAQRNPRSTVGTTTEIYDYLRLMFARIGRTVSPVSGEEVHRHTPGDVVRCALGYSEGTRFAVLAPMKVRGSRTLAQQLQQNVQQGLVRIDVGGAAVLAEDFLQSPQMAGARPEDMFVVVDRLAVSRSKEALARLADSVETALFEGDGECALRIYPSGITHRFSTRFEADGIVFQEPDDNMFSFNSPLGACPACGGTGKILGIDESLVVPDRSKSVYDGAVVCWRGEKMGMWKDEFCRRAKRSRFPIFKPYCELTKTEKNILWHGNEAERALPENEQVSIDAFFRMVEANKYKIQYRVMASRYRGRTVCPECEGTRLRPQALYVKMAGRNIAEMVSMPVEDLRRFFRNLDITETDRRVAARLLVEINSRLDYLVDVGLGYLTLDRLCSTLSGGEMQRICLATALGSSLTGALYILDEPSIGLHSRDTARLINVLRHLQSLGNTVVVVEHDEEIMRASDYIIDVGPEAGRHGGEIVFAGSIGDIRKGTGSHTLRFLTGEEKIEVPRSRRPWNRFLEIKGARENNLKNIDVRIPLNVLCCVTGVSGSGKSTLVRDILYRGLKRRLDEVCDSPGQYSSLAGDLDAVAAVEFVDQEPIGKSSRSNPVTYVKAYDEIRRLMAAQPLSQQMGYTAAHFSFNTNGGRCETCKGEGTVKVEMQFMADMVLECDECHGKRFKKDILDVRFEGKNIHDILEMTVNQAIDFFGAAHQKKIADSLRPLQDVGLGYIKLGQPSSTLSGGENQRVKLAFYLGAGKQRNTLFIFDEPTTGLHFHDIGKLLDAFAALIAGGHSVLVIEHNMDVIKCADHIIDLGPEGGREGGKIVAQGTPEQVAACDESYTGRFLREKLRATALP
jgi:excinuclease ABC subunit A